MINFIKNLFTSFVPASRPAIDEMYLQSILRRYNIDSSKFTVLVGLRGFYNVGQNQRKIYDDAIFIIGPDGTKSFNANTDPGAFKKGIANLKAGNWIYKLGIHGLSKPKALQYIALVQARKVIVHRDEIGDDSGWFGINIHKGGNTTVSSLGCQTIHPKQWDEFISIMKQRLATQKTVTYILEDATKSGSASGLLT